MTKRFACPAKRSGSAVTLSARTGYWRRRQGLAGVNEVAEAALLELRRAQPNISLAWIAHQIPFKRDVDRDRYLEGFRRAGLK